MKRSFPHQVQRFLEKKSKPTIADYLNNFERRRRFRDRVKSYFMVFFFVTYGVLLYDKVYNVWVTRKGNEMMGTYLKRDSVYRDSLNNVIHNMEEELTDLRYQVKRKKK